MLNDSLLGRRVVVRYRRPESDGRAPLTDVVGELVSLTETAATISGRRGSVEVPLRDIQTARAVSPDRRQVLDLELIASRGWRAAEVLELDGWILRADHGWTSRANSILPAATPSRPLPQLLADAGGFYAERGLPFQVQVPLPARGLLDAELAKRCWQVDRPSVVLTRPLRPATADPTAELAELAERPSGDWLAAYHHRGGPLPDHAVDLLTRHDRVQFAQVRVAGQVVGIARGAVDDGWVGVTAVEVSPAHRRAGHARALMHTLLTWAVGQGATQCYLQLEADNAAASAFYTRLGFTEHHRYHYRVAPESRGGRSPRGR